MSSISRRQLLLSSMALPAFAAASKTPQPGIVLIVVDYLPAWAVGCYGSKDFRTPSIDRLALTGVRFLNHYASAPSAAQGRATLLSGRTTAQIRNAESAPAESSLSALLSQAGYDCKSAGKGPAETIAAEGAKIIDAQTPGKPFFLEASFTDLTPPYNGIPDKFRQMYVETAFESMFPAPPPSPGVRRNREMLGNLLGSLREAGAAITEVDDRIGALLSAVDRKGLMDSTLVVVTASCGSLMGQHGLWGAGEASDPVNMFQESVATPMIWRWPLRLPPNTRRPEMIGGYSLVPSLLDIAGVQPAKGNFCARSYAPLAVGQRLPRKEPWRNVVHSALRNVEMVRDSRYKLVQRDGGKGPGELYDLQLDSREANNVYDNPNFVTVRNALASEIAKFNQSCG